MSCSDHLPGPVLYGSTYGRGNEYTPSLYTLLDLTALGRQEAWEEPKGRAPVLHGTWRAQENPRIKSRDVTDGSRFRGIEGLGPVHVGDRDDDYLEVVIRGSGGNPNTASRPGFPNEVTRLIPRSVTVSTQTP